MAEQKRQLVRFVTFPGDEPVTFGPGDELPAEYAKKLDAAAKEAGLDEHPAFVSDES